MRKSYSSEFKLKAASMVLDEGQSVCASLDMGPTALRRWVDQVRIERLGSTPEGAKAITASAQDSRWLRLRGNPALYRPVALFTH